MEVLKGLEQKLAVVFKGAPALPKNGREGLVKAFPWIALIFGILQLLAAWWLWQAGHNVNEYVDNVYRAYGIEAAGTSLGAFYWLSLGTLVADGVILLLAYPKLVRRLGSGWDLLFLGAVINAIYGLVATFSDYRGGVSALIGAIIGSVIAFYLLFQVRGYYSGKTSSRPAATK